MRICLCVSTNWQGMVKSFLYTIFDKSRSLKVWLIPGIWLVPRASDWPIIKDILLHLKQNMFFFEMDSERTLIEKGIRIGCQTITNLCYEHVQPDLDNDSICQEKCKGSITLYLGMWRCDFLMPIFITHAWRFGHLIQYLKVWGKCCCCFFNISGQLELGTKDDIDY